MSTALDLFKMRIKRELFSFMSLSISLFVLFFNYYTNQVIPIQQTYTTVDGVVILALEGMSPVYVFFMLGLLLIIFISIYLIFGKERHG